MGGKSAVYSYLFCSLFPYAIKGISNAVKKLSDAYSAMNKKNFASIFSVLSIRKLAVISAVFIVMTVLSLVNIKFVNKTIKISGDEGRIAEYMDSLKE